MQSIITKGAVLIAVICFSACVFFYAKLSLTEEALGRYKLIASQQEQLMEAVDRIDESERRTQIMLRRLSQNLEDTPNAEVPIPQDVATIWIDGINRMRNDAGISTRSTEELQGPSLGGDPVRSDASRDSN